jgi:hypothetical protein
MVGFQTTQYNEKYPNNFLRKDGALLLKLKEKTQNTRKPPKRKEKLIVPKSGITNLQFW